MRNPQSFSPDHQLFNFPTDGWKGRIYAQQQNLFLTAISSNLKRERPQKVQFNIFNHLSTISTRFSQQAILNHQKISKCCYRGLINPMYGMQGEQYKHQSKSSLHPEDKYFIVFSIWSAFHIPCLRDYSSDLCVSTISRALVHGFEHERE